MEGMFAISSMYCIASIIPSIALLDWVLKGSIAVFIFSLFQVKAIPILAITFGMWFLNFAIPTLVGCIFVFYFTSNPTLKPTRNG